MLFSSLTSGVINNLPARMRSSLSPYLYLTCNEFLINGTFPAYQKLVRPHIDQFALSPYLHLKRRNVNPLLPVYQLVVRPTLEQRHKASLTQRFIPPTTGIRSPQYGDRSWHSRRSQNMTPTTGLTRQPISTARAPARSMVAPQFGTSPLYRSNIRSQFPNHPPAVRPRPMASPTHRTMPIRTATPFTLQFR